MSEDSGDQRQIRIAKLAKLREAGVNPYPGRFERTHSLDAARKLPADSGPIRVAGRLLTMRVMGKLSFATLQDESGRFQVSISEEDVGAAFYKETWKKLVDLGDFIGVEGRTWVTKTGEPTCRATQVTFLGKTLRPLPEKWHGISDQELCQRRRYLDLVMNRATMDRFLFRSKLIRTMRAFLESEGFVEIETPVLSTKASGAAARPFISHHNALDMEVFLRIAPETYLKRAIVGGFDKVFEFARCFRNEGMDPSHLQDFTMLEYYCAYWNYADNMRFTERLVQRALQDALGTTKVEIRGETIDFSGSWPRVTFRELIKKDTGIDLEEHGDAASLREAVKARGIELSPEALTMGRGNLIDELYKKVCRPKLSGPVFLCEHPIDLSPLARRNDQNPSLADRFQVVVKGWEIVNAYSELVDPVDQRKRFEDQAALKAGGDEEAMDMDEDYLLAMEHGMPPISGWGMGIDRLCALLTNVDNLRDVVLFPLLKPE
jgi:lysyl-tRNA synthetase, class II